MNALEAALVLALAVSSPEVTLRGRVLDEDTGAPLPCRITIRGDGGEFYFARSAVPEGNSVEYRKAAPGHPECTENHVTLSAHPFSVSLPAGTYTLGVEHGKEYLPETRSIEVGDSGAEITIRLRRWIDMAGRGWYSGETHVHRKPEQLPNLMLAEDLNVAFPLTFWVTESGASPKASNKEAGKGDPKPRVIDATHVFYPRNTEYEIFRVGGKSHTLGALFILNHQTPLEMGVPPVGPVAQQARREGGLLDLDKHNWPWSAMLAPVFKVDLYELANNHMWEAPFAYRNFGAPPPAYMQIPTDAGGWSEAGWIDYTFQAYYAFLNCGLKMVPTAGCASGVHPVPVGFGRVYVHLDGPFSYGAWIEGLKAGRSFVTTGPMLFVSYSQADDRLRVETESATPISKLDIIVNGEMAATVRPEAVEQGRGYAGLVLAKPGVTESSWIAVRCFEERPDKRVRFAHSAPLYIDVPGKPLRPRRAEVEALVARVEEELKRDEKVLTPEALAEYREALRFYQNRLKEAR